MEAQDPTPLAADLGTHGCMYNYVVSAHKPTNVTHSVCGSFTSSKDLNLIIGCVQLLEHGRPLLRNSVLLPAGSAFPLYTCLLTLPSAHTDAPSLQLQLPTLIPLQCPGPSRKCTRIEIHKLTEEGLQVSHATVRAPFCLQMLTDPPLYLV